MHLQGLVAVGASQVYLEPAVGVPALPFGVRVDEVHVAPSVDLGVDPEQEPVPSPRSFDVRDA